MTDAPKPTLTGAEREEIARQRERAEKAEQGRDVERNAYFVAFDDREQLMAQVARVEALAEDLEAGGYWPPWQALAAGRIRAALAEPERDEEGQ